MLAFGGNLSASTSTLAAGLEMPVDMYTVILAVLAIQREDDGVGAPRRRGGDRRVVDVGARRPSTNANSSNAGAA